MIRHICMWNYAGGFTAEQNRQNAAKIKAGAEALRPVVDGIISLDVCTEPLASSSADLMLNSLFESPEALQNYQNHPAHRELGQFIASCMKNRACFDCVEA